MKRSAEEILKRHEKANEEHSRFREMYEDVFEYGMPGRYKTVNKNKTSGTKNRDNLFASVFEQACDKFVQSFQSLICPVNVDWIDFEAGHMFTQNGQNASEVNNELSKIANICNIYKGASNFDTAFTEMSYDIIPGTACLCALEGTPDKPLRFSTIPFVDLKMEEGIDGEIDTYYRSIKIKNCLVEQQWQGAKHTYEHGKDDEEVELVECTYYDYDIRKWHYAVVSKKGKFIVERIYKCSPFIDLRWSKCAGETYGRGPGLKVISDVKSLNKIKEYSLRALAFTIPTFTCTLDEGYNPEMFELIPGALNPVPSNATANPTVRQLQVNPMPELANYNMTNLEMNIKQAMFDTTIPNDPQKGMTALEISTRVAMLDNTLNNAFGRMLEFLYRLTRRIIEILQRFGIISNELDVGAFNGFGYKIKINTRLANQQTQQEINQILQSLQYMASLDPQGAYTQKVLKLNELVPYLLEKMGIPNQFIRTSDEIEALNQQEAEAMAMQQQAMMEMDVASANAKEQGKVDAQHRYE